MSEYQRIKARALELQRDKEAALKLELAHKADQAKAAAKEEAERRKRMEEASKEARRRELKAANDALHKRATGPAPVVSTAYDPFAEDQRAGPSSAPIKSKLQAAQRSAAGNGHTKPAAKSKGEPRPRSNGGERASRKSSPPVLGRKEKAALKLQREAKGHGVEDSLFSVRALVDAKGGTRSSHSASPAPRAPPPRAPPRTTPLAGRPGLPAKKGTSVASMKKGMDVSGLRKLCPDRDNRDYRTPDEIQRDIRLRKGLTASSSAPPSGGSTPSGARDAPRPARELSDIAKSRLNASAARPNKPTSGLRPSDSPRRRARSPSSSSGYDSESPPPRKRARSPQGPGEPSREAVSAIIQSMFARPGGGRAPRRPAYDDDSGSDMEAGFNDVAAEERRALKIARREDEEAEREEAARKAAKDRLKRQRS